MNRQLRSMSRHGVDYSKTAKDADEILHDLQRRAWKSYFGIAQTISITNPANLHLLFDDITTPWIILPRAYNQLKRHHVHYFPPYLEMIENETNEEALHIFTRIAIEFLANFSIRFADNAFQKEKISKN